MALLVLKKLPPHLLKLFVTAKAGQLSCSIKCSDAWLALSVGNVAPHAFKRSGTNAFVRGFKNEPAELRELVVVLHFQPRFYFNSA